jgi:hypothetical protein
MLAVLSYMIFHCFFMVAAKAVDVKTVVNILLCMGAGHSCHKRLLWCLLECKNSSGHVYCLSFQVMHFVLLPLEPFSFGEANLLTWEKSVHLLSYIDQTGL